jgi:threonine dehydrogenase-like Zn-dependent dehydrogenase
VRGADAGAFQHRELDLLQQKRRVVRGGEQRAGRGVGEQRQGGAVHPEPVAHRPAHPPWNLLGGCLRCGLGDQPRRLDGAIHACRKGGTVFILGVFAGAVDKFPLGAVINKGLTVRGAQMHGQRYIPMLLDRMAAGELSTSHPATHSVPLDEAPRAYDLFKHKTDGCVRAVIRPGG